MKVFWQYIEALKIINKLYIYRCIFVTCVSNFTFNLIRPPTY